MVNLATIVEDKPRIGKMHHIVYELAAYDLGVFLTTMRGNMRAKRNVTPDRSRTDSCCMWPGDLIVESRNLADALDYLHSRLYNTSKISLAHNDIKPDNILVVYPDSTDEEHRYPVGKWKLADFGLSRVKVQRQHDKNSLTVDNAMPTPRRTDIEITHRIERSASVSKTTPKRDTGKYTAPEIDQKKIEEVDGRSADLWSFGCVLSEIIAYAVTLDPKLVEEFREALYRPVNPEQPKFLDQRFYDVRTKEVKCCFPVYLDHLAEVASQDTKTEHAQWTNSCIRLVKSIVVKDPAKRLRADQIRDCLRDIDSDMRKDKKMWLSNVLHVDTTHVADADHSYSPGAANASATESPKEVDHFPFVANGSSAALDEAPTITFSLVNHSR
jgi:serine/threonine protein kinase